MPEAAAIGSQIRDLRESRGMTQAHLAAAAEVSERTVRRLETDGKASHEAISAICSALGTSRERLNMRSETNMGANASSLTDVSNGVGGLLIGLIPDRKTRNGARLAAQSDVIAAGEDHDLIAFLSERSDLTLVGRKRGELALHLVGKITTTGGKRYFHIRGSSWHASTVFQHLAQLTADWMNKEGNIEPCFGPDSGFCVPMTQQEIAGPSIAYDDIDCRWLSWMDCVRDSKDLQSFRISHLTSGNFVLEEKDTGCASPVTIISDYRTDEPEAYAWMLNRLDPEGFSASYVHDEEHPGDLEVKLSRGNAFDSQGSLKLMKLRMDTSAHSAVIVRRGGEWRIARGMWESFPLLSANAQILRLADIKREGGQKPSNYIVDVPGVVTFVGLGSGPRAFLKTPDYDSCKDLILAFEKLARFETKIQLHHIGGKTLMTSSEYGDLVRNTGFCRSFHEQRVEEFGEYRLFLLADGRDDLTLTALPNYGSSDERAVYLPQQMREKPFPGWRRPPQSETMVPQPSYRVACLKGRAWQFTLYIRGGADATIQKASWDGSNVNAIGAISDLIADRSLFVADNESTRPLREAIAAANSLDSVEVQR